jgi:hypothetical protein
LVAPPSAQIVRRLRVAAAVCAIASLGALVSHILDLLPMVYFLTFFGVPSMLLLLILAVLGRRLDAEAFLTCLVVGAAGGLVATLAYDAFRLALRTTGLFAYDGFKAIYIFGSWISGQPATSAPAAVAGWFYHFWNGVSFGIFYALIAGRRHWFYGVGYGAIMESVMLGLFPVFLRITDQTGFIAVGMLGHIVYGAVLGLVTQAYGRAW